MFSLSRLNSSFRDISVLPRSIFQAFSQANWMVVELKGSSVKERHWKQLMKQLRVVWVLSDLTLGQVLRHHKHFETGVY